MEAIPVVPEMVTGSITMRRIGGFGFPIEELSTANGVVAHLGRDSSFRIFFGKGRRVRLIDGTEWRIKATTSGRHIVPIIKSDAGVVAVSGPLFAKRSYGINLKGHAFTLIPLGHVGLRRPGLWSVRRHEDQIAAVEDQARVIHTSEPLPVAAALLVFTLIKHGIPGEGDLLPKRD